MKKYTEDLILEQLFNHPSKEFHIRLLAKETKLNPNTIINSTKELLDKELITINKDPNINRTIIKPSNSQKFKLKKKFYNIQKIIDSGLIDYIESELYYPTIILYGSFAKADNHEDSNIDLFIMSEEKPDFKLKEFEEKLNHKINFLTKDKKEVVDMKKDEKELLNNILNGHIITGLLEIIK